MAILGKLNKMTIRYKDRVIVEEAKADIYEQARIAVIGANGSGKTSLLEAIFRHEQGIHWMGNSAEIIYMEQEVGNFGAGSFDSDTRLSEQKWHIPDERKKLSGGEMMKLRLAHVLSKAADVYLLDEPTNHLDLPSREELERALYSFEGTLLIATHDRYFMEKLSDKLLVFEGGSLSKYEGGYWEWLERDSAKERIGLLQLERERQEVLGKLSFMKSTDKEYDALDLRFKELTASIKSIGTE